MKENISIDDFSKLDIRVGQVIECIKKEGSDKLLRLLVDFGQFQRIIFTGIAKWYTPESFIGKYFVFIVNLEPKKIMNEESQGMMLAAVDDKPVPLIPLDKVSMGAFIQ